MVLLKNLITKLFLYKHIIASAEKLSTSLEPIILPTEERLYFSIKYLPVNLSGRLQTNCISTVV